MKFPFAQTSASFAGQYTTYQHVTLMMTAMPRQMLRMLKSGQAETAAVMCNCSYKFAWMLRLPMKGGLNADTADVIKTSTKR